MNILGFIFILTKNKKEEKMRILANYGYKNNGDTYSVTFETVGDVPKEQADAVVDELFQMAKRAIERQINPDADPLEFPPKEEVTVPQPKKNGNGKPQLKDAGLSAFRSDTSKNHFIRDPNAPATKKQKLLIIRLAKERGQFIDNLNDLTMQEASEKIDELMEISD